MKNFLNIYEEALFLVSLLFSRKDIDKIWNYFPAHQMAKLHEASAKIKHMEKADLVKRCIIELKRLMENEKFYGIDENLFEDKLKKEPRYLHEIIKEVVINSRSHQKIPRYIILQSFLKN